MPVGLAERHSRDTGASFFTILHVQGKPVRVYGQPLISRETRRLLVTILVSVTALWVLARIRFQERAAASTPVPNVLAQLRPISSYADLARAIADIRPVIVAAVSASAGGGAALRIREDAAITLAPGPADTLLASDRATGLAIVRHEHRGSARSHAVGPEAAGLPAISRRCRCNRRSRGAAPGFHGRTVSVEQPAVAGRALGDSSFSGDRAGHFCVHHRWRIRRTLREPR